MSCVNSALVLQLANRLEIAVLDKLDDKKDKLRSKLFMKKLELAFSEPKSLLQRCVSCSSLFTKKQRLTQECEKARVFVDANGRALKQHIGDESWDLNKFIAFLRGKKLDWKLVFWKLVACTLDFSCKCCNEQFSGAKMNTCNFHLNRPFYGFDPHLAYYACCNSSTQIFDTNLTSKGCQR